MTKQELAIAKTALYQYELLRIKRFESLPLADFYPTEDYQNKKQELRVKIQNRTLKCKSMSRKHKYTVLIAALVALALIATACAFGKQIKGFLVNFFASYATLQTYEDAEMTYTEYDLTWVPENYEHTETLRSITSTIVVYQRDDSKLRLYCQPISYFYNFIDTQHTEFAVFDLQGMEIYYKEKNELYSFYWLLDDTTLYLSCSTDIAWSDIETMILSVDRAK